MLIEKEFYFDSAHFLPHVPLKHKCRKLHGHTYKVVIGVEGPLSPEGWVIDFADIGAVVRPTIATIDHTLLNAVPGLDNPTAENIALWIYSEIKKKLPLVSFVTVQEGVGSRVTYPSQAPVVSSVEP